MAGRIYLANGGVNASHRFGSPIFPDGTFEFIPIPEDVPIQGDHAVRYGDLRAYNNPGRDLRRYIPRRLWDRPAHSDPEFDSFTYGDNCELSPRAASLRRIEPFDFLFFLARLEHRDGRVPAGRPGFYLIGFLEVVEVLKDVTSRPKAASLGRFRANAHVRRGLCDSNLWDRFWVFRGSQRSRRFPKAVPVTRELAAQVFRRADGSPWRWPENRTDLQVIGSYTRSCRCVLDPQLPGHAARASFLWDWVARYNPETDTQGTRPGLGTSTDREPPIVQRCIVR